nr:reverse transcriptase domain-containing protein [Tanacetum cinerariifolium]
SMATTRNLAPPGAIGSGLTISIHHCKKEAVILIEISVETRRIQDFDPMKNDKRCREELDILEERREIASIKEAHYKQKLE